MSESTDSGTQDLSTTEASNLIESMLGEDGDFDDAALDDNDEAQAEGDQTDDDDDEGEEEQEQPTSETYEVKVNGETEKVTLEELKSGYMKDAYFRQLTAEAQSERRELAQSQSQTAEISGQLNSLIEHYQTALQAVFDVARPDVQACYQADPSGRLYAEKQAAFEQLVTELQRSESVRGKSAEMSQEQLARAQALYQANVEREIMLAIPEWGADRDLAVKEVTDIGNYARSLGYDKKTLQSLSATDMKVLRAAMKWEQSQAKKPEVDQKLKNLPPVKSGKAKTKSQSSAFDAVRKTGDKRAAHAAIMNLL